MRYAGFVIALLLLSIGVMSAQAQARTDNPHGTLPEGLDCANCHRTDGWTPLLDSLLFDHNRQTTFPLTGSHTQTTCATCHLDLRFDAPKVEANNCATCHVDVHLGQFEEACIECHNTTTFLDVNGLEVHNRTQFPLTGAHAQITCASCHTSDEGGAFSPLDTECLACHTPDYDVAHAADGFPTTCDTCHGSTAWLDVPPFDHTAFAAGFALLGAHDVLPCSACHTEPPGFDVLFAPAGNDDCLTCHQADYDAVHNASFPTACLDCHALDSWENAVFDHASVADGFALLGAHDGLDCAACHQAPPGFEPLFMPSGNDDCLTCHQPDFASAHGGQGYPTTCQTCHNADDWTEGVFDHAASANGFALIGAHEAMPCSACHTVPPAFDPLFTPSATDDCITCHQSDFQQEHGGSGYPTTCLTCHGTDSWDSGAFDHAAASGGFDLAGAHRVLNCFACHNAPPDFSPLFAAASPDDCIACHQPDYQDEHGGDGFPFTCQTCHNLEDWDEAQFDHAVSANGFALIGTHEEQPCSACHAPPPAFDPLFAPSGTEDCLTCHQPDYDGAHAGTGYPTTCQTCHNAEDWRDATFAHDGASGGFGLLGAHNALPCSACHGPPPDLTPLFTPANDQDCYTCHQPDYQEEHGGSGFPTTCTTCHGTDSWDSDAFDHAIISDGFNLLGAHGDLECQNCHGPPPDLTPLFAPANDQDCFACHQPDYQDEHGGSNFPTTCETCHNVEDWDEISLDHAGIANGFGLVGAHNTLECAACHQEPSYEPLFMPSGQDDCITCHQPDYDEEHGGSGFPTTCLRCHGVDAWEGGTFDHVGASGGFALQGAHDVLDCASCHGPPPDLTPLFAPADNQDCVACHQADYDDEHAGSGFPTTCTTCHGTESWDSGAFDHAVPSGGFNLLGAHDALDCSACHGPPPDLTPLFTPANDQDCYACHQPDYDAQHGGSGFPTTCTTCHGIDSWETGAFDHAVASNGFGLIGAHDGLDCASCHGPPPDLTPLFTPDGVNDCIACHQPDFDAQHAGGGFPTTCLDCHNANDWTGVTFAHETVADGFVLVGAHNALACSACHGPPPGYDPLFEPLNQDDCISCHQPDYDAQHGGSGFPTTCLTCHGTNSWDGADFEHAASSDGFNLLGAHAALDCASCHGPPPDLVPLFDPTSDQDCFACHQPDYDEQHGGSGFPTTCLTCHGTDSWDATAFDHAVSSGGFNLLGAHEVLDCASCHGPPPDLVPLFDPTDDQDCYACHQPDYQAQHAADGFPFTCATCHNVEDWENAAFDHATSANGFALVGAHAPLPCAACHAPPPDFSPLFTPLDQNDCIACHQSDYDDEHAGTGFPTTCLDCHATDTWDDAVFDHAVASGGFNLLGSHEDLDCQQCHTPPPDFDLIYNPTDDQDCYACHQTDYQTQHAADGFPFTCATCHDVEDWENATFNHATSANGFALVGAHAPLPCAACHAPPPAFDPLFTPLDQNDCIACHQTDYDGQHGGSGFPTTCLECHTVDTWEGAVFEHGTVSGGFDLIGSHISLPCSACHGPPPDLIPLFDPSDENDCFTCHQPDFQQEHGGQGYPTTCLSCHNPDAWQPADFNHDGDYFPIFSGKHDEEWNTCQDCHQQPDDFMVFTCLTCHTLQETNEDHDEVPGYIYESNACYSCHPNGEKD